MKKQQLKKSSKLWVPHEYQKKAITFQISRAGAGLLLDPGLGKTSITVASFDLLRKKGYEKKMLVIAPLRVAYSVWPEEVEKWSQFNHLRVSVLHGRDKEKALQADADIYVINFEGIKWLVDSGGMADLIKRGVSVLTIDELSKLKHTNTQRFKLLKPYLPKFRRRWGLTGSPAPNGLLDLFGQIYTLDLGASLGRYVTHYRTEFFYQSGYGGYTWLPLPGAKERIYAKIAPSVLRMDAKDYLELPQQITNVIRVALPPAVATMYAQMERDAFTMLDKETALTAASAAAAMNKCAQIANGGVYKDNLLGDDQPQLKGPRPVEELHTEKVEALVDLLEELQGSPLLVAYEFKHDLDRIRKALGEVPYIGGGVSATRAAELERQWNEGKLPVLFGHPASIGHGLNLQEGQAYNVCWFGLTWDLELYEQFIKRVLRQGNKNTRVIVHHIICRDTVDEAKLKALGAKNRNQSALMQALKEYRSEK